MNKISRNIIRKYILINSLADRIVGLGTTDHYNSHSPKEILCRKKIGSENVFGSETILFSAILDSAIFDLAILNFGHLGFGHLGFGNLEVRRR